MGLRNNYSHYDKTGIPEYKVSRIKKRKMHYASNTSAELSFSILKRIK